MADGKKKGRKLEKQRDKKKKKRETFEGKVSGVSVLK